MKTYLEEITGVKISLLNEGDYNGLQ
jgi:hypothetical protein